MTQAEIESIAREMRARCLHASWSDLVIFWRGVMGNLESAYRTLVHGTAPPHHVSSEDLGNTGRMARDKLAVALRQLAGDRQIARWDAEAEGAIQSTPLEQS